MGLTLHGRSYLWIKAPPLLLFIAQAGACWPCSSFLTPVMGGEEREGPRSSRNCSLSLEEQTQSICKPSQSPPDCPRQGVSSAAVVVPPGLQTANLLFAQEESGRLWPQPDS